MNDIHLGAHIMAYIADDKYSTIDIVPNASSTATRPILPTERATSHTGGWVSTLTTYAVSGEPGYLARVSPHRVDDQWCATVELVRRPSNLLIGARQLGAPSQEQLAGKVAGFCLHRIRNEKQIVRRTARWERWRTEDAYTLFRQGIDDQRDGLLNEAEENLCKASQLEPGNLTVRMARGQALELLQRWGTATEVYERSRELWPESIEARYRLIAACTNGRSTNGVDSALTKALAEAEELKKILAFRPLAARWSQTWRPTRWNVGERRHWALWIRRGPSNLVPFVGSQRREMQHALNMVCQLNCLLRLGDQLPNTESSGNVDALQGISAKMLESLTQVTNYLIRKRDHQGHHFLTLLLHPDRLGEVRGDMPKHGESWHSTLGHLGERRALASRRGMGSLARMNTACYFSQCISLGQHLARLGRLPEGFTAEEWEEDFARAALKQIGADLRDPHGTMKPDWISRDPDLLPLKASRLGGEWLEFAGMIKGNADDVAQVKPPD